MITVYSTGCPKCKVLEKKLKERAINFEICSDLEQIKNLKIEYVPVVQMENNYYNFTDAVKLLNKGEFDED